MNDPAAIRVDGPERWWSLPTRVLRRVASALSWAALLALGAFGVYFSFANYPALGIGAVLLIALAIGYSERKRHKRRTARENARRRQRTSRDS